MGKEAIDRGRRRFIKVSAALGGGMLVGVHLGACSGRAGAGGKAGDRKIHGFEPNAWVRIGRDDTVTVSVNHSEMGQGVTTALPMIIAEELEADWSRVRAEIAPARPVYKNPAFKIQMTGGSTSVRTSWEILRRAGAAAREMLIAAAAQAWGVASSECRAFEGRVIHDPSGRSLGYGELAERAARLPVPGEVRLKKPGEFRIIGKSVPRIDTPAKTDGSAVFGVDVRMPGLLAATVVHPPVFGTGVKAFDARKAKALPGVRQVLAIDAGVAVVADTFWQAREGAEALKVEWSRGDNEHLESEKIRARWAELAREEGEPVRDEGDVSAATAKAAKTLRAVYEVPYQAHATPEPMNCTAHVGKDACDIWVPTQNQDTAQETAARITGLDYDAVRVHTTFLGGGFGRRAEADYVAEAVQISRAVRAPVKVLWTREEDVRHDFYRPATYHVLQAGLDKSGRVIAWTHRIVGPPIMDRLIPQFLPSILPPWVPRALKGILARVAGGLVPRFKMDEKATEGADSLPYAIENVRVAYIKDDPGIPTGFWRSVGHSQNAFVVECFMDEIAVAAGKDPFELRRELLGKAPRMRTVLELAADRAGWGRAAPDGIHRGIAVHDFSGTPVAQVAEVSVGRNGGVKVHRVVCAVDCGIVINPKIIEAQMEGAIAFGLTAALKGAVTIREGRVEQGNFDDFPLLRMDEMPEVEVHIVPSTNPPSGIGETGLPPIAPAVANAVFAATGRRVRKLPINTEDLRGS